MWTGRLTRTARSRRPLPLTAGRLRDRRTVRQLLDSFASLRSLEAAVTRAEGIHLDSLSRGGGFKRLGFASIGDLCREMLGMPERTARERVVLHRILSMSAKLESLYMAGEVTACQVLAIAPALARAWNTRSGGVGAVHRAGTEPGNASTGEPAESDANALPGGAAARAWIERARHVTVRRLKEEVRRREPGAYPEERHSRRRFTIDAPVEIKAAYREFLEVGRKVIGYDAPPGEVMEAILAETGRAGLGGPVGPAGCSVDQRPSARPASRRRTSPRLELLRTPDRISDSDRAVAEEVVADVTRFRTHLSALLSAAGRADPMSAARISPLPGADGPHGFASPACTPLEGGTPDPAQALAYLQRLREIHSPIRIMKSRLIRAMRRVRCDARLGFDTVEDFVADRLGISPRLARDLVSESLLFDQFPALERAFAAGRIGITKAHRVGRMTNGRDIDRWIARAENVMHRSFERECDLLSLLRRYDSRLAHLFSGPFPHFGMERILSQAVCEKHGLTSKQLERELKSRGVIPLPARASLDPAQNPPLLRRLEVLVLLLCTSAQADTSPKRQMFAVREPHELIGFGCSDEVFADLTTLIDDFERAHGPLVPRWVPVIMAAKEACDIWSVQDPERVPSREALLRRDEYHCTFPGCSRRRMLEGNHIHLKSRGGSNLGENITNLCFTHHREVFHAGYSCISGVAPHALRFEIGVRPGGPPLLVTIGNLVIERNGRAVESGTTTSP